MSGGKDSIQTSNGLVTARLASLWAKQLPTLLIWQKNTWLKKEQRIVMSCKICPYSDWVILPQLIELIMTSESPSTINLRKPNSVANRRARHAASNSTISIEAGSAICCVKAATTNSLSLRIIMPRPALFSSAKSAPSKLTLSRPDSVGCHLTDLAVQRILVWIGRSCWYSWRPSQAIELIIANGTMSSSSRSLFLHIQISEVVHANRGKWYLPCCAHFYLDKT